MASALLVETNERCTFEEGDCGYDLGAQWSVYDVTPDTTFPNTDHTSREARNGHVMYISASNDTVLGITATAILPEMAFPIDDDLVVQFWLQSIGTHPYRLQVFITGGERSGSDPVYSQSMTSTTWTSVCLDEVVKSPIVRVVFVAIYETASDVTPQLAIDDVSIDSGAKCVDLYPEPIICTFDDDLCGWTQANDDVFDWTRRSGRTSTIGTGPDCDHTTCTGSYVYIESSSPRSVGDNARLESPPFTLKTEAKLMFWYNMYGAGVGSLHVYIRNDSTPSMTPSWSLTQGTVTREWHQACLTIDQPHTTVTIIFEGIRGQGYTSDIALDDITLEEGACTVDGNWSVWSNYSACAVSCGPGYMTSYRSCSNPAPAGDGLPCTGVDNRTLPCDAGPCPVNGNWSDWTTWSVCSVSCDLGVILRNRSCDQPAPSAGGTNCTGSDEDTRDCSFGACPEWSRWFEGTCSVSCGDGTMARIRQCSTGSDVDCPGSSYNLVPCEGYECFG